MKCLSLLLVLVSLTLCGVTPAHAQGVALPKPGPELEVLKTDVGTWDVTIKAWAGPGEPMSTKGKETGRMLGGHWLLVDFEGNMMGMDFQGHGLYGYDPEKKQYIGTWVDSLSPKKMEMVGQYDKATQTLTYEGLAPGPDGTPVKHLLATKYGSDGNRVMTMHMQPGAQRIKIFEMSYSKSTQ